MGKISLSEVLDLSVSERIQLAEDIWDTIPAATDVIPLTEAQRTELERRLESHQKTPNAGSPWAETKARILDRT